MRYFVRFITLYAKRRCGKIVDQVSYKRALKILQCANAQVGHRMDIWLSLENIAKAQGTVEFIDIRENVNKIFRKEFFL